MQPNKHGIIIITGYTCYFWKREVETTGHLFIKCSFIYALWMPLYSWVGLQTAFSGNLESLPQQHVGLFPAAKHNEAWNLLWYAIIWTVWLHRNEVIFSNGSIDWDKMVDLIKFRVWSWQKASAKKGAFSYLDWIINPQECLRFGPWSSFYQPASQCCWELSFFILLFCWMCFDFSDHIL